MIINLKQEKLEHIKEISFYNHNFYKLPFKLEDNDILCEEFDEFVEEYSYSIGYIVDNKYISKVYFIPTREKFEIDISTASDEVIWC